MNDTKNKLLAFAIVILYIPAVLGGIGYLCHIHQGFLAFAIAALGVMAWPVFRDAWKLLWGEE